MMTEQTGGILERLWISILGAGERTPLFVFTLIVFAGMAWLIMAGLKLIRELMAKWEKRDEDVAARERESIATMARIAAPLERIPGVLESQRQQLEEQGRTMRQTREEMQQGFRALSLEIQAAGEAGRRAWREATDQMSALFQQVGRRSGGPQ